MALSLYINPLLGAYPYISALPDSCDNRVCVAGPGQASNLVHGVIGSPETTTTGGGGTQTPTCIATTTTSDYRCSRWHINRSHVSRRFSSFSVQCIAKRQSFPLVVGTGSGGGCPLVSAGEPIERCGQTAHHAGVHACTHTHTLAPPPPPPCRYYVNVNLTPSLSLHTIYITPSQYHS